MFSSLYCVLPVITQAGYLALRVIASYTDEPYVPLLFVSIIGSGICR